MVVPPIVALVRRLAPLWAGVGRQDERAAQVGAMLVVRGVCFSNMHMIAGYACSCWISVYFISKSGFWIAWAATVSGWCRLFTGWFAVFVGFHEDRNSLRRLFGQLE